MSRQYHLGWLALAFVMLASLASDYIYSSVNTKKLTQTPAIVKIIPERLRSLIAASLWERADHLMHKGPVFAKQQFYAGSYAGNTDIVPLLKMVIALCPTETAPYRLLASNYAFHLDMKEEALKLIDKALKTNEYNKRTHELYASKAFILLFSNQNEKDKKENLQNAAQSLEQAINTYSNDDELSDPAFKLENYYVVLARIHWDLGEPAKALECWNKSSLGFNTNDLLAKLLNEYNETGKYQPLHSDLPLQESEAISEHQHTEQEMGCQNENCHHDSLKDESLLWLGAKAGLLCLIAIIFWCSVC